MIDNFGCQFAIYEVQMANENLDEVLRKRAAMLHLTQGEVAGRAGISRQAIVKILAGEVRDPRISTVIGLARALQLSPFYLLRCWLNSTGERGALTKEDRKGDRISFVGMENLPNGAVVAPNALIEKSWTIQNTGDAPWRQRQLRCLSRADQDIPCLQPDRSVVDLPDIAPGECFEFKMTFRCPSIPGLFASYWKMADQLGQYSFPDLAPLECIVSVIAF